MAPSKADKSHISLVTRNFRARLKKAAGLLEALTAITCLGGSPESAVVDGAATVGADPSATGAPDATVGASALPDFDSLLADCSELAAAAVVVSSFGCCCWFVDSVDIGCCCCGCCCCCCCSRFAVFVPVLVPSLDNDCFAAPFSVDILCRSLNVLCRR